MRSIDLILERLTELRNQRKKLSDNVDNAKNQSDLKRAKYALHICDKSIKFNKELAEKISR